MARWTDRLRSSLPRRRGLVQPGNTITRAIEHELTTGLPAHLPSEPAPVPAPVVPTSSDEQATPARPSSAA